MQLGISIMLRLLACIFIILEAAKVAFSWDNSQNTYPACTPDVVRGGRNNNDMCVMPEHLIPALRLMKHVHPELKRLAVQSQCGPLERDGSFVSPLMTKERLVQFVFTKTDLEQWQCMRDLRNLKKILLANPHWNVEVVAPTPIPSAVDQRSVQDNHTLVFDGGLQATDVDLPWACLARLIVVSGASTFALLVFCALSLYGSILAWSLRPDLPQAQCTRCDRSYTAS